MILKRIFDDNLAQASYLLGCNRTKVGLVVDPNRNVEQYIEAAAAEGLRIVAVTETHIHADFVSGARELARQTGAELYLSGAGGDDWSYAFAIESNAELLSDHSRFRIGDVEIDVLHTPGHTPEHLTFLVTDGAAGDLPMGALTGDFIFVGDVGRPDLLERAAGAAGTKEAAARDLFRSLQRFKHFPDYLQIWPGHGAGSSCGKALGAMPQSTLGYERLFNWGLVETDEDSFVKEVLAGQPDPPAYFALMKQINRDGPPAATSTAVKEISAHDLAAKLDEGAIVVDTRPTAEFSARHAASSISIPRTKSFLNWAGSLLPYDREVFFIVAEGDNAAQTLADDLALIGFEKIGGVHTLRSFDEIEAEGVATRSTAQIAVSDLRDPIARNGKVVLDVRAPHEWDHGHIPGAVHIPLGTLPSRLSELPKGTEIAVHCQGGSRSAIAASILEKSGIKVSNVAGGFAEWARSGGEVERGSRDSP